MMFEKNVVIAADHPSLEGHFPGHPIVPGVVILDEVLQALADVRPSTRPVELPVVKFLAPLQPAQMFMIRLFASSGHRIRFECIRDDGQPLAQGFLRLADADG